jgi:large subunit ribosomal protein L10e
MGLRKASAYSMHAVCPYTRISRKKSRSYIKVVPPQKIVKFTMGNLKAYQDGKYPYELTVRSREACQIRNNALEACRQYVNKKLDTDFLGQFLFKVVPFPHHIQRENKMLTGAGADRMSTGMARSYGRSVGKAALVKVNGPIFFVAAANPKITAAARKYFQQVKAKLPCHTSIIDTVRKVEPVKK